MGLASAWWFGLSVFLFLGVMAISGWRGLDIEPAKGALVSPIASAITLTVLVNSKKIR